MEEKKQIEARVSETEKRVNSNVGSNRDIKAAEKEFEKAKNSLQNIKDIESGPCGKKWTC